MENKCKWGSDKPNSCSRTAYGQSGYCLFHKPNKTGADAELFLKIINFNEFSPRLRELLKRFYSELPIEEKHLISIEMDGELQRIRLTNFTEEEKKRRDFEAYMNQVVDLYREAKISGNTQESPNFRGFVFPSMESPFRYVYNPFSMFPILDFTDVIFEGCANFSGFQFIDNVTFKNATFRNWVIFTNAIFNKRCQFVDTDLDTGSVHGFGMFENTRFLGEEVIFKNVKGRPSLNITIFASHTRLHLIDMQYPTNPGEASYGENAYRVAKVQANAVGDYSRAGDYYYLERVYKRMQLKKGHEKAIDWLMDKVTGYGEKPLWIVRASIGVIFFFAIVNFFTAQLSFWNALFYSAITFSTLGAKIPEPLHGGMKASLALESLVGGLFIALLVLTLAKRYSRG